MNINQVGSLSRFFNPTFNHIKLNCKFLSYFSNTNHNKESHSFFPHSYSSKGKLIVIASIGLMGGYLLHKKRFTYKVAQCETVQFKTNSWSLPEGAVDYSNYYFKIAGDERSEITVSKSELKKQSLVKINSEYLKPTDLGKSNKIPASKNTESLKYIPYLVIGGGPSAIATVQSIRASDPTSKILMISRENAVPFLRPALSKELWRRSEDRQQSLLDSNGDMNQHSWFFYEPNSFYLDPNELNSNEEGGVGILLNTSVIDLNPQKRFVKLSNGTQLEFGQCCIATGARPRQLNELHVCSTTGKDLLNDNRISYYRTIEDYKNLRKLSTKIQKEGGKIVLVGGGFLGCELACSLADFQSPDSKLDITLIVQENLPMAHVLPPELCDYTKKFLESKGVKVRTGLSPNSCSIEKNNKLEIKFSNSDDVETNISHAVIAIGTDPNTDLVKNAIGLEIDDNNNGIIVNAELEALKGIFVAGDVCSFFDPLLGRRRVDHQNFAEESGRIAGKNMANSLILEQKLKSVDEENVEKSDSSKPQTFFDYQTSMWSYLGPDLMWDGVGLCDPHKLNTFTVYSSKAHPESISSNTKNDNETISMDSRSGVVFYVHPATKRIMGILLWNLPEDLFLSENASAPSRLHLARQILLEKRCCYSRNDFISVAREFDLDCSVDAVYQRMNIPYKAEENNV